MQLESTSVALLRSPTYQLETIKQGIERLCSAVSFAMPSGVRVLLKPNLITASRQANGLQCTHPQFIAAVAEWCIDHGARVLVGDSPAFGTAKGVMAACGITDALRHLPVQLVNFSRVQPVCLADGTRVGLAAAALECDFLFNLPRVKTHCQFYVTLAIKNYFGTVVGLRKPWWHMRYGGCPERFARHLVDLLVLLPAGVCLADGIVAMQGEGPVSGRPYNLVVIAGSRNPVAMDTALLDVLGLRPAESPVGRECLRRGLAGAESASLTFPLLPSAALRVADFSPPAVLKPIRFHPYRVLVGGIRRLLAHSKP